MTTDDLIILPEDDPPSSGTFLDPHPYPAPEEIEAGEAYAGTLVDYVETEDGVEVLA